VKIIELIFYFVTPFLIVKGIKRCKKLGFISPILLCYVVGILLGNQGLIPIDKQLAFSLSEITIPIAIPLILFSTDFKRWLKLAPKTILSFILVAISAILSAVLAAILFSWVDEYWKIAGMLVGVYTGGTPNLMAIGLGLQVKEKTLILTNTSDALMGGLYFLFLVTGAQWLIGKVLPPFSASLAEPAFAATEEEGSKKELIDTDTMIITSTAGIFGPAFIGPVAERLKNREVIVPGLTCGLVGYAIGNYLGFAVAWLLTPR